MLGVAGSPLHIPQSAGRIRPAVRALGILLALSSLCAVAARAAGPEERAFLWQQANTAMGAARTPADFAAAAGLYAELAAAGARSGALFQNEGTALLLAGRHDAAVRSILRAERYAGARPELARNLREAAAGAGDPAAALPWYRVPLFWHYGLPCAARALVAAAAFSMLWVAGAVRLLGRPVLARSLAGWSAAVLVVFGSSVAATLHAETSARRENELASLLDRSLVAPAAQPTGGSAP